VTIPEINPPAAARDLATVFAKLARSNEHSERFKAISNAVFGDAKKYDLAFRFDHKAGEIHVTGCYIEVPPVAYLGAVFGDALNCARSALDHVVWALSLRHQTSPPPPFPIPWSSPWKRIGFPIVHDASNWNGALTTRLALVDPALHSRFYDLQPFVTNPADPSQAWLQMLDDLWNIDKHRAIHIGRLTVAFETLTVRRRINGALIPCTFQSSGPQSIDLYDIEAEANLGRLTNTDFRAWPETPAEMQVERGFRVNLFLDPSEPGLGKNMEFAMGNMHNAVVLAAHAFEPEFT
jgi:hypothetical protein